MKLRTFRIGGVHPEENKITAEMATQVAALPKQAIFPLGQHIGAPAKPVVAKGDKVKVGTLLAEAGGFVSAPIYSSVSGTVFKVDQSIDATGYRKPCIIINVEGDEWEESIDRSEKLETIASHPELTPEEIVNRIKVAGVTGMVVQVSQPSSSCVLLQVPRLSVSSSMVWSASHTSQPTTVL